MGGYTPQGTWAELPIKLINNDWYALKWEDNSYWISETTIITKGLEGLGHLSFTPMPTTSCLPLLPPGYTVRLKLAFCTTCVVRVLVLAQGPSF